MKFNKWCRRCACELKPEDCAAYQCWPCRFGYTEPAPLLVRIATAIHNWRARLFQKET